MQGFLCRQHDHQWWIYISVETANKLLKCSKMFVYSLEGKHVWHQVLKMRDVTWNSLFTVLTLSRWFPVFLFHFTLQILLPVRLNRIAFCGQPQPRNSSSKERSPTFFLLPVSPKMMNGLQVCWMQNSPFSQLSVSQRIRAVPKKQKKTVSVLHPGNFQRCRSRGSACKTRTLRKSKNGSLFQLQEVRFSWT